MFDCSLGGQVTLGFMYASFIATRQFFSITQAAIVEDPTMSMDANACANVVVLAGIGFGISKVCSGLLVDRFEARVMTYCFMLATALVVFTFSFAESYEAMLVLGFLNSLPQAGGYPGRPPPPRTTTTAVTLTPPCCHPSPQ